MMSAASFEVSFNGSPEAVSESYGRDISASFEDCAA
jgi:hypothetical protein